MKAKRLCQQTENRGASAHTSAERFFKCQQILLPLDFSNRSWRALKYAVFIAAPLRAKISLVHVIVPEVFPISWPFRQLHLPELVARAGHRLTRVQTVLKRHDLDGEVRVCVGLPFEEIIKVAHGLHADLLVITSHGRTGLKRYLLGSAAELVLRHAPCPVIILRDGISDAV